MTNELRDSLAEAASQVLRQRDGRSGLYRDVAVIRCADENIIDRSFRFEAKLDRRSISEIQALVEAPFRKKVNAEERSQLLLEYDSCTRGRTTPCYRGGRDRIVS